MIRLSLSPTFLSFMLLLLSVGCQADGRDAQPPTFIEIETGEQERDNQLALDGGVGAAMKQEAVKFRAELRRSQGFRSGVYVYSSRSIETYKGDPKKLAARLALMGLDDVYLSASKNAVSGVDAAGYQWLRDFNRHAHTYGLTVWATRFSDTKAYVSDATVTDECARLLAFNQNVSVDERFDAVGADWEPHVLKQGGADTPAGLSYFWDSTNNYGKGGSNDMLLKRTLDILQLAKDNLGGLRLNEAISYLFQTRFDSGLLNWGSTAQFVGICDYAVAMCYYYKKETIWNRAEPLLTNASAKRKSVSVCIKTSLDTYGDGGDPNTSVQPQGWAELLKTLNYLYTQGSGKVAFRGVDFFEFEGLEIMWNTTATALASTVSTVGVVVDRQSGWIELPNRQCEGMTVCRIVDASGRTVRTRLPVAGRIDVRGLAKGCYFLELNNRISRFVL